MPRLEFNSVVVGILGVTAGILLVAAFHCIRVCLEIDDGRRRGRPPPAPPFPAARVQNIRSHNQEEDASSSNIRSFSTVRLLIATNYSKECKEETCSVCLSEFKEGDEVRVLPGCAHVFHVLCIDKWLLSRSNCPLCRADTSCSSWDTAAVVGPPNTGGARGGTPPEPEGSTS